MHTNPLIHEKSPYLLQHAHNPVDWRPWGEDAFRLAREHDKPIFLSVGYSTCHWCHVMERESFEDLGVAETLNQYFVPVKVDREERPDIDRIYMLFVQATTGSGGWPMSVFLTPDLKPFFGGTYFPPDSNYGRPGFRQLLEYLATAWAQDRSKIIESGESVIEQLRKHSDVSAGHRHFFDARILDSGYQGFRRMFDSKYGGFGGAPKFPRPAIHNFLMRYSRDSGNAEAAEMVLKTLIRPWRAGGMNDQLGGGFHRYSVDERWFVSHFEKMLYDQAQLAISYLDAFRVTGDSLYADVARRIFEYVLRDMTHPDGGFYSAEDADSVIDTAEPSVKGEGAFYVWTQKEIEEALGDAAPEFCLRYGVEPDGNVRDDPHGEFRGKNVLFEARFDAKTNDFASKTLLKVRNRRIRPHLDDKILTAWNGLMISAFAQGAQALGEPRYLEAARRASKFIEDRLYQKGTGILLRRFRDGEAAINGFADDYSFYVQALIDLYEADFSTVHLDQAVALTDKQIELFHDSKEGGFFSTAAGDSGLVLRMKDDHDGAEPSANSVTALNLFRLTQYTGRKNYRELAEGVLQAFATRLQSAPVTIPQMLVALSFSLKPPRQIVVVGERGSASLQEMIRAMGRTFLSHSAVFVIDSEEARSRFGTLNEAIPQMREIDGKAAAYVCENFTCQLPVTEVADLIKLLQ